MGLLGISTPSQAQSAGIAIVVNDGLISYRDLQNRLQLIIASSGLPDNQDTRNKLLPQIAGDLITEELQFQEARKHDIQITDEAIDVEFAELAKSNKMTPEQFEEILKKTKVNIETLRRQLEARLAWNEFFTRKFRTRLKISDNDVEAYLNQIKAHMGQTEYLLSEIYLPVSDPKEDKDILKLADKVVSDLKAKKASFAVVAQQISKAPGAAQGGTLGWVPEDQLEKELAQAAAQMEPKTISDPIRALSGYYIYYLSDRRQISEDSLPTEEQVKDTLAMQRAERLSRAHIRELQNAAFIDNRMIKNSGS